MLLSTVNSARAIIPGPGTQVAFVSGPSSANGGTLPYTDAAFANFTFTNLPWENVTAGNLTAYQIVVMLIEPFSPSPPLSAPQEADLVAWISNGGKLIMYDSEMTATDYSWLPYPFTTNNPGAGGWSGQPINYMEDDTLGDNNASSPYYIDTVQSGANIWADAVGDGNVFVTQDIHWCGHIEATNGNGVRGWVHTYAVYGYGLMIYNGLDIDALSAGTVPGTLGIANVAKLFLLELQQPWGTDYNLPCTKKAIAVGGTIINDPTLLNLIMITVVVAAAITTFAVLSKKLVHFRFPRLSA
jgi:hypothetical protein